MNTKLLKNTSSVKKVVKGVGVFQPGRQREVSTYVANHFKDLEGWELKDTTKPAPPPVKNGKQNTKK